MFTGLVEGQGTVEAIIPEGDAVRLTLKLPAEIRSGLDVGDSVAINGCCLTVIGLAESSASFQAGTETLSKTNLGDLQPGSIANLERSLPVDGRMGGHFVQGHVDGVGQVREIRRDGEWVTMFFEVPDHLARYLAPKGSVAVDGISLTVVDVASNVFSVALIPHTLEVTTLGVRKTGDSVNIETDILAKYVERLVLNTQDE